MWRWIAQEVKKDPSPNSIDLKYKWLKAHPQGFHVSNSCFFCHYAWLDCDQCPGALVDKAFSCQTKGKDYAENPIEFYKYLKEVNKKRLEMRKGAKR